MARGFESKAVADQQESARERKPRRAPLSDTARATRRRGLELSRADVVTRLASARAEGHKEMLRRALAALDKELASLR
jgi:hypothetical protein